MSADSEAVQIVKRFVDGWHRLDADAIAACFAQDAEWLNSGYEPIIGRENIAALVARFVERVDEGELRLLHVAEGAPGTVLTERLDVFRLKSGATITIPVMGAFDVDDRLIRSWRDYFDPAVMNA
jgi:limonene-1,2-epoxide hydrolase